MWKLLARLLRRTPLGLGSVGLITLTGGVASTFAVALLARGSRDGDTASLFALACAIAVVARVASQALMKRLAVEYLYELRMTLCRNISSLSLRELEEIGANRVHAMLSEDTAVVAVTMSGLGFLLGDIAIIVAVVAYMASISLLGCVLSLVAIAAAVLFVMMLGRISRGGLQGMRECIDDIDKWYAALAFGAKELRMSDRRAEAFLVHGVEPTVGTLSRYAKRDGLLTSIASGFASLMLLITMGIVTFGFPHVGVTDVGPRFVLALLYASGPVYNVVSFLTQRRQADVALANVERMGLSMSRLQSEPTAHDARPTSAQVEIELEQLVYSYGGPNQDGFRVGPIDLALRSGEVLFVIGGNGSGKSTLLKLLLGLYRPQSGDIRLNGSLVGESDLWWFRRHFAAIFADYHLFDRVWEPAAADQSSLANEYLRRLGLADKVRYEGGAFTTTKLSTGQRKRLALVTALLEDKPVYAFDEWAADQDPFYKRMFYEQIIPSLVAANKAVIAITHDEQYFHVAGQVVKLADGRRKESDTSQFLSRLSSGHRP